MLVKIGFCHSEQSEESGVLHQILRFAQNDKILLGMTYLQ